MECAPYCSFHCRSSFMLQASVELLAPACVQEKNKVHVRRQP